MKQNKFLGVLAIALSLALAACGNAGGESQQEECKKHTWGEWQVVQPNTCTEDGSQKRVCSVCGKEETKVIKAAHTWGEWKELEAATCQKEGSKERECSVCHQKETGVIEKADHTYAQDPDKANVEPTCTAAGTNYFKCTVCGETKEESVTALGHDWGDWVDTKAATCDKPGAHKHVCSRCNAEEEEEVEALGHDLELVGGEQAAPTGEATVRVYKCKRCGETYLGFKADEPSAASLPHLMVGDNGGMRFFGRPIGNSLALDATGKSEHEENNECVYCSTETGDFFEYIFTLTEDQANLLSTCRLYCDARPADHLSGDFWAYGRSATDWTPGYYIDGAPEHVQYNDDGTVKMVKDHARCVNASDEDRSQAEGAELETEVPMGARIEDYRYVLYVDDVIQEFDADTAVPAEGSSTNMVRKEYVLPFTFHLHKGQNKISLRMAGGYRSEFYNFIFRPYVEPTQLTVNEASLTVEEGKTAQITSSFDGLTYKSSSSSIATVDANGVVTGVKAGSATITVSKEGNFKDAKVAVTVTEAAGIIRVEAEQNQAAAEALGITFRTPSSSSNASGAVTRDWPKDVTLSLTFDATAAQAMSLYLVGRANGGSNGYTYTDVNVSENLKIEVNGAVVTIDSSVVMSGSTITAYLIGEITTRVGPNTIDITCIGDLAPTLDFVRMIPKA